MHALAQQAYGTVQKRTASSEELEITIIKQITRELELVVKAEAPQPIDRINAISRNLRMWTIFTADLANKNNQLPDQAKATLISIGEYVRRESMKLLSNDDDVIDLVEVNQNLLISLGANASGNQA